MSDKKQQFFDFLEKEKDGTKNQLEKLNAECRDDEAKALMAKLNIYDIFRTLFVTAENKSKGDNEIFKKEFTLLSEKVPSNWHISLAKAREHGDFGKIMIEEAKISAADGIIAEFGRLF